MYILFLIGFYFLAMGYLYCWYRLVVCAEVEYYDQIANKSKGKTFRETYAKDKQLLPWMFGLVPPETEQQRKAQQEWEAIKITGLTLIFSDAILVWGAPIIISAIVVVHFSVPLLLAFVVIYLHYIRDFIKNSTQKIISLLVRIGKLFDSIYYEPGMLSGKAMRTPTPKKECIILASFIFAIVGAWMLIGWLDKHEKLGFYLFLAAITANLFMWIRDKLKKRECMEKQLQCGMEIDGEAWGLDQYREKAEQMCKD